MIEPGIVLRDSVTKTAAEDAGRVLVTGSHGGLYAANLAARARVRAAIFNDAGIGKERADMRNMPQSIRPSTGWRALALRGCLGGALRHLVARSRRAQRRGDLRAPRPQPRGAGALDRGARGLLMGH